MPTSNDELKDLLTDQLNQVEKRFNDRLDHFEKRFNDRLDHFEKRVDDKFAQVDKRFDNLEERIGHIEKTLDGNGRHGVKTRLVVLEEKIEPLLAEVDANTQTRREILTLSKVVKVIGAVVGAALLAIFSHLLGIIDLGMK